MQITDHCVTQGIYDTNKPWLTNWLTEGHSLLKPYIFNLFSEKWIFLTVCAWAWWVTHNKRLSGGVFSQKKISSSLVWEHAAERKNKNDHEEFYVKMIILLTKEQTGFNEISNGVSYPIKYYWYVLFLQTYWIVFSWSLTNVKKSNLLFETSFVPVNDKKCKMTRICSHTIASLFWSKSKNQIINCFNMPLEKLLCKLSFLVFLWKKYLFLWIRKENAIFWLQYSTDSFYDIDNVNGVLHISSDMRLFCHNTAQMWFSPTIDTYFSIKTKTKPQTVVECWKRNVQTSNKLE